MNTHQTPALSVAVGLLVGASLRQILTHPGAIPLAALLLALAIAADSWLKFARCLAAACLGMLWVDLHGLPVRTAPLELEQLDLSRPVKVVGRVANHPLEHQGEVWLLLEAQSLRQGRVILTNLQQFSVVIGDSGPVVNLQWGQRLSLTGYLRQPRRAANGGHVLPAGPRLRLSSRRFATVLTEADGWYQAASRLRVALDTYLQPARPGVALARAVILGDRHALPVDWQQALSATGLSHLLSISGLHVGLLVGGLWTLAAFAPRNSRWALILGGLLIYVVLVGPRPAILRAAAMAVLWLLALAWHRPPQALNALSLWLVASVLMAPEIVRGLGFKLTSLATAGILLWPRGWPRLGAALPHWLRLSLAVSLAAQLATMPVLLPVVGGFSPLTPLFNLLAIPWLASFLLVAAVLLLPAALGYGLQPWAATVLDWWSLPVAGLAKLEAGRWLFVPLQLPSWAGWLLSAGVLTILWRPALLLLYVAFFLVGGAPHYALSSQGAKASQLEVVMIDVGQGDAILLRDGDQSVLVDGGGFRRGDVTTRVLVPTLSRLGVRRLQAIVLSHPDRDHCQGLLGLRRFLPVDEVWAGPGWAAQPCATKLLSEARRWRVLWAGRQARVGRWQFDVLWPPAGQRGSDDNERSLVLRAQAGSRSILLTGDIGHVVERVLARSQQQQLSAEVLKVAHHGSKGSSLSTFITAVSPSWAMISAAEGNPYGHPHRHVLERLSAQTVLRTDHSGILRLRADADPAGGWHLSLPAAPRHRRP